MVSSKDETQIQISVWVGINQGLHCSTYVRWDFQNARSWGQIRDWYNCQLLVAFESEAISYIIAFPWYIVINKLWAIMLLLLLFLLKSKLVFVHANFSFPWHKRPEKYFLLIGRFVKLLCDVVSIWKSYVVNANVDHFPICPAMTPNMSHSLSFLLLLSMWYELIVNIFDFSYVPCPGLHGKQKKGWIANFLLLFWDSFLDLYTFLFLYLAKVYKFINIIVFTFVAKYCLSTLVLARYFHTCACKYSLLSWFSTIFGLRILCCLSFPMI